MSFEISPDILDALKKLAVERLAIEQYKACDYILKGRDVLEESESRLEKTVAFAVPMLMQLETATKALQVLILVPTCESALRIEEIFKVLGHKRSIKIARLVGGEPPTEQILALQDGAQIAVGTPGRIKEFVEMGTVDLSQVRFVVVDEADRMANLGFIQDVATILESLPENRQLSLFTTSRHTKVDKLARDFLRKPQPPTRYLFHRYVKLPDSLKPALALKFIERLGQGRVLVVARDQEELDKLASEISAWGNAGPVMCVSDGNEMAAARSKFQEQTNAVLLTLPAWGTKLGLVNVTYLLLLAAPPSLEEYFTYISYGPQEEPAGLLMTLLGPQESFDHITTYCDMVDQLLPRAPTSNVLRKKKRRRRRSTPRLRK